MITGLNTLVRYGDQDYQVQTEDHGLRDPIIVSTIYRGGAVVGSKKTSYEDFLESGSFHEATLRKMLEAQHYGIVRAIGSGRVAARQRARSRTQAASASPVLSRLPHVELLHEAIDECPVETRHEMRIRIVDISNAAPVAGAEVSVEIFGSGLRTHRLKGVTDSDGYLNLAINVPRSHRIAAAMLFHVMKPDPGQELKVLLVKSTKGLP
jgi:hypothetical protein